MLVLQMSLAICFGSKSIIAKLALERLFTSVCSHVPGQGALIIATVVASTNIAYIWRLSQMLFIVAFKSP